MELIDEIKNEIDKIEKEKYYCKSIYYSGVDQGKIEALRWVLSLIEPKKDRQRPNGKNVIDLFCMASNFSYDGLGGRINDNLRNGDTIEQATKDAVENQKAYEMLSKIFSNGEIREIANILNNLAKNTESDFLFNCDEE